MEGKQDTGGKECGGVKETEGRRGVKQEEREEKYTNTEVEKREGKEGDIREQKE